MGDLWPTRTLAEVCGGKGTYGLTAPGNSKPVGPKFLRTTDMIDGTIDWSKVPYCEVDDATARKNDVRHGDIVISRTGANAGASAFVSNPPAGAVFAGYLVRFRADPKLMDSRFLGFVLKSSLWRSYVENTRTGSAQPQLNAVLMGLFRFPLPPLDEQRCIAGVLGALDDLIEVNRALARDIERLAQSLASTASAPTKLSSFTTWGGLSTVKPAGQVDHYSLPAFDDGQTPERVDGSLIKSNKQQISQPCVLVARLNPHIPRVWMVYPEKSVSSLASTEFVPICAKGVPNEAVYAVCSAPTYSDQMNGLVTGTTGSHQRVDKDALTSVEVPDMRTLPAETLEAITLLVKQAHALRVEIRELEATRDELLPLLLSGRVRVGDVAA